MSERFAGSETIVLGRIPFELDADELMQKAHVRTGTADASTFCGLVETARGVGKPKALYRECWIEGQGDRDVTFGGTTFTSLALRHNLAHVERVFAFVATCGAEMDAVELPAGDMLAEFWWDTIKAALLWSANLHLRDDLCHRYALEKTATMSPGAGDVDVWPIEQQKPLFGLLGDVEGMVGVRLTDSCLMVPNKTVSGVLFPSEAGWRTCQVCHRPNCPGRSAPFDPELWESVQHS